MNFDELAALLEPARISLRGLLVVIAGLDPAIHPFALTLFPDGCGSNPRMTSQRASARLT
jgi:hypothetical protein